QAEDGIRDKLVTGVQTCALPIFFIPVGANLPSLDELRQAGVVPKRTLPPKVAVFGVSEWPAAQKQEVDHIARAMRQASEALGERSEERRVGKEGRCGGGSGRW